MKTVLEYERRQHTGNDPRESVVVVLAATALIGFCVATMCGVLFFS